MSAAACYFAFLILLFSGSKMHILKCTKTNTKNYNQYTKLK